MGDKDRSICNGSVAAERTITIMNKVILMGRLTKNPEIKYAGKDNDMAVARYTLAVNEKSNPPAMLGRIE